MPPWHLARGTRSGERRPPDAAAVANTMRRPAGVPNSVIGTVIRTMTLVGSLFQVNRHLDRCVNYVV